MDLPWLGLCVCVWCGVNRNRKWVLSSVINILCQLIERVAVIDLLFFH